MLKFADPRAWPSRLVARYLVVVFIFAFGIANYALWNDSKTWDTAAIHAPVSLSFGGKHPIKKLMKEARTRQEELLAKRSHDVADASAKYRARRGRHPPPGFEQWFKAAMEDDAVIVEEYFDRIYKDLTPFWALETDTIKKRAHSWPWVVRVRNGSAYGDGDVEGRVPWLKLWTDLVEEFAESLPDVDMPINYMDEPRLLVPFEEISKLVGVAEKSKMMPEKTHVTTKYQGLSDVDAAKPDLYDTEWSGISSSYWDLAVKTCGPDTPAHGVSAVSDYTKPAEFPHNYEPDYAFKGYIKNWTAAMDPCMQPHLRQLHGTFVAPLSLSSTNELIPLFGGSKLPMNNEIIIPGAMYLTDDEFYSGGNSHGPAWPKKKDGLVWRGDASGGRTTANSWQHFQRHRLIDMLNWTTVSEAEATGTRTPTFELPPPSVYKSPRVLQKTLGSWLRDFADVSFVHLCLPGECDWLYNHFRESKPKSMSKQYSYKFLPDVDGNSFSARFRGFMLSTSAPLKATIYAEWHDDRLVPWVHFIPLDNTFRDLYPVLEFFADGDGDGDAAARFIAEMGQAWAQQVLRREDMKLYVWRLLLEWARVCDENRATLGYVQDLA